MKDIKFTKEEQELSQANLERIKKNGILLSSATFNSAVNGADQTPEDYFDISSNKQTRRAKMYLLPTGAILCEQEDMHGKVKTFFVPPTYKFAHIKE